MQSSPAPARRGPDTRGEVGRPKSSHLPPARPAVPGNLWLAQALNHMTAQAARWVQGGLEYSSPSQPLQAQTLVGSLRKSEGWACVQGPKRGLKERTPTYPAGHLQTGAGTLPVSSGPDLPDHSALPCANLPQTHIIPKALWAHRGAPTCQVARSGSSSPPLPCRRDCPSSYLDDKLTKSPPSSSRTLQKRTPFTKGTAVSSSRVKVVWNLNFFFFIKKAMSEFPESEAPKAEKGGEARNPQDSFPYTTPPPQNIRAGSRPDGGEGGRAGGDLSPDGPGLSDQSSSRAGWLHRLGAGVRSGSERPGASPACKQWGMAQKAGAGVAGGARAAALAGSIPHRGLRGALAALRGAAGGPVRPRAAGGPAPAPLAAGGGALAAHTPPHLGALRPAQVSPGD